MFDKRMYGIWRDMIRRCFQPNRKGYNHYGGRGITVCDRWRDYDKWREDIGEIPVGMSMDRIDNDGNYEPGNVRIVASIVQNNNTRGNRKITAFGKTQTLMQWSREMGIDRKTISNRIDAGIAPESAMTIPTDTRLYITVNGEEKSVGEWAKQYGITSLRIHQRLTAGWTPERAVTTPVPPRRKSQRSSDHYITYDGRTQNLADWARDTGIEAQTIRHRLKYGWTLERTLTERSQTHMRSNKR
jgi:hypothetical protein